MKMENENFNRGLCAAKRSVGDFIGIKLNSSCAFVIYFCLFLDFTLTIFSFFFFSFLAFDASSGCNGSETPTKPKEKSLTPTKTFLASELLNRYKIKRNEPHHNDEVH
ncbi:hypothetical protein CEXT_145881 [Caerostris extrusa]|uniref:Uncharacterized protein n=1 Tax=Caerostris extrusa TaxID=172846 RepID=A0AAV4SQI6_CAEEX|nr:hypothetical protein CEXT_145881 [Caerostris extrusa]